MSFFGSTYRVAKPILFLLGFYLLISQLSQTLLYTIITYFVSASGKTGIEFSNTVNEIASQYIFLSFSLGALLVAGTSWMGDRALYRSVPFWNDPRKPFWQLDRFTKVEFFRGISSGMIAALVFLLISTLSRQVNYLGIYITSTVGTPVFPLFFTDLVALVVFVVCEEYIFRHKIFSHLLKYMGPGSAVLLTSTLFTLTKHFQFELQAIDYFNLFCLNFALCFFYLKAQKCHRGLGFLASLLGVLHPIAGLPLWSHESPSFFLFKTTARSSETLSGGAAGPMAGLGLLSIVMVFTIGGYLSWKRSEKNSYK